MPTEPTPAVATEIVGPVPDTLLGGGLRPRVDPRREYLASGGTDFPLAGQILLSKKVDDLTRDLGIQVYEVMMNDPTVASGVFSLITGVLAGDFQLIPVFQAEEGEEGEQDEQRKTDLAEAEKWAEFCRRQVGRLNRPIDHISAEFLQIGMTQGTRLAEVTYEDGEGEDAGRMVVRNIRHKRNASWSFVVDPYGDIVAIRGLVVGGSLEDMPPDKFMVFAWMPTDGDPRGHSILRAAYNGWNLKINIWPKYYQYLETFANPTTVGIAALDAPDERARDANGNETGQTLTPTEAMLAALNQMQGASKAALRAGSDIRFVQAVGNGEAFLKAFELLKHEILEAILLNARMTMEAKHSSKKDSESAGDVVAKLIALARKGLEAMWKMQFFHRLIALNAGKETADRYTPTVSFGEVEQQDVSAVGESLAKLGYQLSKSQWPAIDAWLGVKVRTADELAEESAQDQQALAANGQQQPGEPPPKPAKTDKGQGAEPEPDEEVPNEDGEK